VIRTPKGGPFRTVGYNHLNARLGQWGGVVGPTADEPLGQFGYEPEVENGSDERDLVRRIPLLLRHHKATADVTFGQNQRFLTLPAEMREMLGPLERPTPPLPEGFAQAALYSWRRCGLGAGWFRSPGNCASGRISLS
jgi:hypothetical protein